AVHVHSENVGDELEKNWAKWVEEPAHEHGMRAPELVVLRSPYRLVLKPILDYVRDVEREHPDQQIAVILPNLVERRWYQRFLHNQRAELLTALLLVKGDRRISIINVPWYTL